ncbi:MAG: RidA family protein [Burkholderiales bacterium]|nr:RidA family protein [Burkholderiales bacterium]
MRQPIRAVLGVLLCLTTAASYADEPKVEYLRPPGLVSSPMFSQVTTVSGGKLVFVSGQVSWDEQGKPVHPKDLRAQTRRTFENLQAALAAAGGTLENVVKLNIYVVNLDREKWRMVGEERAKYISKTAPPASTMVGVPSLVLDELLIEIEAVAVVKE